MSTQICVTVYTCTCVCVHERYMGQKENTRIFLSKEQLQCVHFLHIQAPFPTKLYICLKIRSSKKKKNLNIVYSQIYKLSKGKMPIKIVPKSMKNVFFSISKSEHNCWLCTELRQNNLSNCTWQEIYKCELFIIRNENLCSR